MSIVYEVKSYITSYVFVLISKSFDHAPMILGILFTIPKEKEDNNDVLI
jgi:hypothetical protein